jgi:Winged helix-turn helix
MTVIAMSRTEIDRMSVLQDLATSRIRIAEAATLMGLGRRQVFRLAKAYAQRGPAALVSRKRGRPSNHAYPADLSDAAIGIIRTLARSWQRRSWRSFMTFTLPARRSANG